MSVLAESSNSHRKLCRELSAIGRRLSASGLVRAQSGNLSVRADHGFVVTTAGARLDALGTSDVVLLDGSLAAVRRASSELALHLAIYDARPDVRAVIHTHSPYATAWSCVAEELVLTLDEADYYGMARRVPVAEHAAPGSRELADRASGALGSGSAVLLRRHGAVVVGSDLPSALCVAESLEHQAHVAWLLRRSLARS